MSSNINPNNIDTTYPIAGQDNDSQGFRDNFTNIKTNFQYAEDEISDLQTKVLLKAALTGTTLDNDMGGAPISNATLNGARSTRISLGNASTQTVPGTVPVDYTAGEFHTFTLDYNSTLDFQNWPSAGNGSWVRVIVTVSSTAYTLTLPSAVSIGYQTIQGINLSTKTITFGQAGTYSFEFTTSNGGSTITVQDLSRNLDPIYLPSSEDLAAGGAASLNVTTSYFSTSAAETATLAAGYPGQVKVFAMYADSGDMVITVTNAGWKTSGTGTMTFNAIGDACTLMYINSKWFCIGNNGVVFA
jgi:hypothetical protein